MDIEEKIKLFKHLGFDVELENVHTHPHKMIRLVRIWKKGFILKHESICLYEHNGDFDKPVSFVMECILDEFKEIIEEICDRRR